MITGTAHLANVVYYLLLIWEILSSDGKSRDTLSVLVLDLSVIVLVLISVLTITVSVLVLALTVLVPSLILRG